MPYPSLLWLRMQEKAAGTIPAEPDEGPAAEETTDWMQQAAEDLGLTAVLRPQTRAVLRQSCTAEEIPLRQNILAAVIGREEIRKALENIRTETERLCRFLGNMQRAGTEEEKNLWFQPVAGSFFRVSADWQTLAGEKNRLGEIAAAFRNALAEDTVHACQEQLVHVQNRRPDGMQLTVRGAQMYGTCSGKLLREEWKEMFRAMGMEEAIPAEKSVTTATPEILQAYVSVYPAYAAELSRLRNGAGRALLEGAWDIRALAAYPEEITCLLDLAAYFSNLSAHGYPLTYPAVAKEHMVDLEGLRDPTLLQRQIEGKDAVPNDIRMLYRTGNSEQTNFFLLTGANGGGKTTFLRACALAVLFFIKGCPITAEQAELYPFTALYTHFPAEERFEKGSRYREEAARAEEIQRMADADSFAVFNETFSGTDEEKSAACSAGLAQDLYDRGVFGLYVTHLHGLTGKRIPTLAAVVDASDEHRRTYTIRRVRETDCSYAADILKKYHLDRASLKERLRTKERTEEGEAYV